MAKEMTREEKLWTMTGTTLLGVAENLGLNVNKNTLKQGKEKLIAKILEAEKKLENGANNEQMEAPAKQEVSTESTVQEEQPTENSNKAEDAVNKPKRRGRTRDPKPTTEPKTEEKIETKTEEKITNRTNLKIKELTYKGKTQTIRAWADELQMPWATLYDRVNRNGWSVEDAIEIPLGQRRK